MLAIRLQRLGRKAYPVYRVAVQEAQRHPSSGRVVAYVGSYNPHTKDANKLAGLPNVRRPASLVLFKQAMQDSLQADLGEVEDAEGVDLHVLNPVGPADHGLRVPCFPARRKQLTSAGKTKIRAVTPRKSNYLGTT